MYNIERKAGIMKILEESGRVEVNGLASYFYASRETIRRDLREMESDGLLTRTHGGAVANLTADLSLGEQPVEIREIQHIREKSAICKRAAEYIQNGDSIFVDNSSTCLYLLQFIPRDYQITLFTNSLKLLIGLTEARLNNVMAICLGGQFNSSNFSTYGSLSLKSAADFYPNKAFMSCAGIHLPDELTDSSFLEVDTKRLMIERSQQTFLLADHTKFGRTGQVFLSNFSAIDLLITDLLMDPVQLAPYQDSGMQVIRTGHTE